MHRRDFIKTSALTGAVAASGLSLAQAQNSGSKRLFYELRHYQTTGREMQEMLTGFMSQAAIPALNRLGIKPVGVFIPESSEDFSVYTLTPFENLAQLVDRDEKLAMDDAFLEAGRPYLSTTKDHPAYTRIQTTILQASKEFPGIVTKVKGERLFELRIYESHNEERAQKKLDMFDAGEFDIFDDVGLNTVFFGKAIAGQNLPNLTYMLAFKDMEARSAAWKAFGSHPDWDALKNDPQYRDTVSKIIQVYLKPAEGSQI